MEVEYWSDADDLEMKLFSRFEKFIDKKAGEKDFEAFNRSLTNTDDKPAPDRWQVLSPERGSGFGTERLNRLIQLRYHGGLLHMRGARPLGAQQIVYLDKVMQIQNQTRKDTDRNEVYVANGDVGLITDTWIRSKPYSVTVSFVGQDYPIKYVTKGDIEDNLELAYATTVHKSQGSDFDTVFFVLPKASRTLSRELMYTAITRFKNKLVLFLEGSDVGTIERFSRPEFSNTAHRNTYLFFISGRPDLDGVPYPEKLIHRSKSGTWVRSKSELIVARALDDLGVKYKYEERLPDLKNPNYGYLPDFTIYHKGEKHYWEHLGMLDQTTYRRRWDKKLAWYKKNKFHERLIISKDGSGGSIDEIEIFKLAKEKILGT